MKKLTNQEVIDKLTNLYGETCDCSKIQYVNTRSLLKLVCKVHGEFYQHANNALQGRGGCLKCKARFPTQKSFIDELEKLHPGKFEYDKVVFATQKEKIILTCKKHGDFICTAKQALKNKEPCAICKQEIKESSKKTKVKIDYFEIQKQRFFNRSAKIHNNKYDYSKSVYKGPREKIEIICPIHGSFFQSPRDHVIGKGCKKCASITTANKTKIGRDEFLRRARNTHGIQYEYGEYKGMHNKMEMFCPTHGLFLCTPHNHIVGCGCPNCANSYGEKNIHIWLNDHGINHEQHKHILIGKHNYYVDFYLEYFGLKFVIEFNGIQHYQPINFFGGEKRFKEQQKRDQMIRDFCLENNIIILEVSYQKTKDEIYKLLNKLFIMCKFKKRLAKLEEAKRWFDKLPESEKAALTRPGSVKQRTI